ncbi:MAG: efflux RND transporter permease subunit [Flavobacteriales bacterium]|nr:efflux RND transporter permease subunit [Flavobacteriales bacterium]MCB9334724.1 efflux RND transporter permease subunit [Flavobacteriales bacterium]
MLNKIIRFFLENKLVAVLTLVLFVGWGIATAPFNWDTDIIPRNPVAVDAIPDIGENQQIVFTKWMGRSPQDVDDQITYPLTTALLGVPGVKTIRSNSMFGFSSIYIIFNEDVDFYWSRSRILEKLNSLPSGTLPDGVQPALGPDATALGQIYWYTLEGRDKEGNPTGGWDPQELRSIQDFTVKYGLASVDGVAEVASIGGFVKEYQIDIDPNAMKAAGINIMQVMNAVKNSNLDVGAKTVEINRAEYLVRGLGYIDNINDLEEAVVTVRDDVPIRIKDIAKVNLGPASRRGALDKSGAEAVGGVVVARYGANPMEVIAKVKEQIEKISPGLPDKTLADGTKSKVSIVPFYDRTGLIKETLGTLEEALSLEILITIIVIILMLINVRASMLISGLLPVAVLMCFIAMKNFGIDANIVALSGIAIAIGTMVDMGVVLSENMIRHLDEAEPGEPRLEVIYRATVEVATAVITAVTTTIVSFIPVFTMEAAEGKLFKPLAYTKTFALLSAIILAIIILPPLAHWLFSIKIPKGTFRKVFNGLAIISGLVLLFFVPWAGLLLIAVGIAGFSEWITQSLPQQIQFIGKYLDTILYALVVAWLLAQNWLPLGPSESLIMNYFFVCLFIFTLIILFYAVIHYYSRILRWCLDHKTLFLSIPLVLIFMGMLSWIGFQQLFGLENKTVHENSFFHAMNETFPGIGKEFMPSLDEGSFLLMPTSMPHSGIEENVDVIQKLDMAVTAIPEVESVVGKLGRVESALDPAPISMYENIINYQPEYKVDEDGNRLRFKVDDEGIYVRDEHGNLQEDKNGKFYRNWRDYIHSPDDIWNEIAKIKLPGVTSAPKLQPIETRLIMLQTGMRAPMGIKVKGPDLKTIEAFGLKLEDALKQVEGVKKEAVFADRIVGKPYLEIDLDRKALGRYGLTIQQVQHYIEIAIGGMQLSTTVDGRERYPIRVRYARELRDAPDKIEKILIPAANGTQIPLGEVSTINYVQGPQSIKSEDTFLLGYVLFDKLTDYAEVDVVESAQKHLKMLIDNGDLKVPHGVTYEFAGNYENQTRAEKRLSLVVPLALVIIFLILYFQFRSIITTTMIFSSIFVAFCGGFIMIWLYGQDWFMNFRFFGTNMRDLFQMHTINLSVAVWVGFIALFGIASDDGVVIATYLKQSFEKHQPQTRKEIREAVVLAGSKRIRPCLMTTATTLLALLPILTSTGRGSDIMVPMAIPSFGGMAFEIITLFIIPVLYSAWQERTIKKTAQ